MVLDRAHLLGASEPRVSINSGAWDDAPPLVQQAMFALFIEVRHKEVIFPRTNSKNS